MMHVDNDPTFRQAAVPNNGALLYHHSRLPFYRKPLGAVSCGTRVTLRTTASDKLQGARVWLRLWQDECGERLVEMQRDGVGFYAGIDVPDYPTIVWYFFVIEMADGRRLYYSAGSGEGEFFTYEPPHSYRITVYDAAYHTPEWFRRSIVYQIFPDRFCRSSMEDMYGRAAYLQQRGRKVRLHQHWSELPEYLPAPGEQEYAPLDYFGGDLNGIRSRLDYIASLGISCIYLNPIFEAASNHRYNTADYHCIDPMLGSEEDFASLCHEAAGHGIHIMLDGVFSHTGSDSRYFNKDGYYPEPGAYQRESSPYDEWYRFYNHPDDYESWWGFKTLPNVQELTPSYCDFIAGENGVLSHWARCGATNWRLDVADELPDEFIRILRRRVKENDPEGVLLGEVWEECSAKRGPEGRRGYVNGDELDSAMDYPFADALLPFLKGERSAQFLVEELLSLREWYPEPFYMAQLNILSTHDSMRALSVLSGAPAKNALPRELQAGWNPAPEQKYLGEKRMMLAFAVQMFMPGVPCIYYGDEAGVEGLQDPFNRCTYPWGKENRSLQQWVRSLAAYRNGKEALLSGHCRMGACDQDVFALVRYTDDEVGVLLVNVGGMDKAITLQQNCFPQGQDALIPIPAGLQYQNGNGEPCQDPFDVPVMVPAYGCAICFGQKGTEDSL